VPASILPGPTQVPERDDVRAPVVRVRLQAPAQPLFPEPGRRYVSVGPNGVTVIRGPLVATLVPGRVAIQVGAFGRDENARAALLRLNAAGVDGRVEVQGDGPRRVVALGRDGEREDALERRLNQAGFAEQQRVATVYGGGITLRGEDGASLSAARFRLVPLDPEPVRIGGKAVRGEFELRPDAAGVAVINVVSLEQYLRGVVPAEMGPRAFPSLEALKAQAVAARTYAVAHLGDHAGEGYDLCDSQACQAYEGAGAEQPLTDRAVAETAGEIATWQGRPIDAMYHSTCAGHTEDAGALFPDRAAPYLKGVPCRGEASLAVGTREAGGPWLGPLDHLVVVGEALARALGVPRNARSLAARLTGATAGPGSAGLVRAFGLDATAAALHVAAVAGDDATTELLRTFRLPLPPPHRGLGQGSWELALVVRLGQLAGEVQAIKGRVVPGPAGVRLVSDGSEGPRDLSGNEKVLLSRGERWRAGTAPVAAGSAATLWCADGLCPLLEVDPMETADAASAWTWWVRELTLTEIGKRLGLTGVRDVRVVRRGVSGRALTVAVVVAGGVKELAGIPFRRALELPDTLFVALRSGPASSPSLRFLGRGWGHGVGMCQNGAYGLARGGETYVQILKTYYTGIEVGPWKGWTP
jgi:peptidoglycan hydrolase-like amidase